MKKLSLFILVAAAIFVAGGFASSRLFNASASSTKAAPKPACPGREFGHIKSLTQRGDHFELRFDPAWFLSSVTANRAALEDTGSSDVPNDNYVVEEGHRALTYLVPTTARVSVLTRGAAIDRGAAITVAQLAQLVKGETPVDLFESLETGSGFSSGSTPSARSRSSTARRRHSQGGVPARDAARTSPFRPPNSSG